MASAPESVVEDMQVQLKDGKLMIRFRLSTRLPNGSVERTESQWLVLSASQFAVLRETIDRLLQADAGSRRGTH